MQHETAKTSVKASIWGTITYARSCKNAKQDVQRVVNKLAKRFDTHIVCNLHEGIQKKRYKKYNVKRPDLHIILGFTSLINVDEFLLEYPIVSLIEGLDGRLLLEHYDETRNDITYSFCGHEDYHEFIGCNHKTKCRRKGCRYKKEETRAVLTRNKK